MNFYLVTYAINFVKVNPDNVKEDIAHVRFFDNDNFTNSCAFLASLKQVKKATPVSNIKNYRADIMDRNGNYLAKTVSSIDIGINPVEIIDKQKLLINLKLLFPKKNYLEIEKNLIQF